MDLSCRGERKPESPISKLSQKANAFSIDSLLGQTSPKRIEDESFSGFNSTSAFSGTSNPKHADLPPGKQKSLKFLKIYPFYPYFILRKMTRIFVKF